MKSSFTKHLKTAKHLKLLQKMKDDSEFDDVFNGDEDSIRNEIRMLCQDDLINYLIEDEILLERWVKDYVSKLSKEDCLLVLEESGHRYYSELTYRKEVEIELESYIYNTRKSDEDEEND